MPIPVPPFAVINVPPNVNVPDDVIGAETSGVSVSPVPPPPPEIAVTVPGVSAGKSTRTPVPSIY